MKNASGRSLPFCCLCTNESKDALIGEIGKLIHLVSLIPKEKDLAKGVFEKDGTHIERELPCFDDKAIPVWEEPEVVKANEMVAPEAGIDEDVTVEKSEQCIENVDDNDMDEVPVCDENAK